MPNVKISLEPHSKDSKVEVDGVDITGSTRHVWVEQEVGQPPRVQLEVLQTTGSSKINGDVDLTVIRKYIRGFTDSQLREIVNMVLLWHASLGKSYDDIVEELRQYEMVNRE